MRLNMRNHKRKPKRKPVAAKPTRIMGLHDSWEPETKALEELAAAARKVACQWRPDGGLQIPLALIEPTQVFMGVEDA